MLTTPRRFTLIALCLIRLAPAPGRAEDVRLDPSASSDAVKALAQWLAEPRDHRPQISDQPFATVALGKDDAERARQMLWEDHVALIKSTRVEEMKAKAIELGKMRMKFEALKFGGEDPPPGGWSLFISMHGGGEAPAALNESQWENQVKLGGAYLPREGIYLAPRAPTDAWNMWHQAHIDEFFARLIENLVVLAGVNPNRVYILGYSAGGDGVYQLGPRMADRWAAAAMMAGHPNDASPLGLRNIGFAVQAGANDDAFDRNKVAAEWGRRLDDLQASDPGGYAHFTELHAGKGHWMDLEDRKAIPWMEKFTRNPIPDRIVWHQDDVTHDEFYWLAVPPGQARAGQEIVAGRQGQSITLSTKDVGVVLLRLNDAMLDLDQPVIVQRDGAGVFNARVNRTIGTLARTLESRGDRELMFSAEVTLAPAKPPVPAPVN